MNNIDWKFIEEREGNKLTGYVPNAKNSKSGVTIASGFDLGARNLSDLSGLPEDIVTLLKPFLGFKGAEAQEMAKNLKVSQSQSETINEFAHKKAAEGLASKWKAKTGQDFAELPKNKATVIASVAFQYGDLETKTPNFWRQVTEDDWGGAIKNLRDFGDDYDTRRNLEADFVESGMSETELESKKKFEQELARDKQYGIQEAMISGEEGGLGSAPTADTAQPPKEVIEDLDIPAETVETLPITEEVMEEPNIQEVPQDSSLSETLPTPGDIYGGYTQLYGNGEQYGQRIPSKLNEADEYDYRVFDEDGWDVWGAAFRQHNFIPSLVRMISATDSKYQPVADYDPFQDKELINKVGSDGTWRFRNSKSPAESTMLYNRMQEDAEDMMLLNSTPSVSKQLIAGLATPTTFAPIAPLKVLQAANRTRRFVGGAAFTAALTAPEQLLIDSQNTQRDTSHTAIILAGASLLGGGLSVAFGKAPKIIPQEQKLLTDKVTVDGSGFPDGGEALYRPAGAGISPERARQAAYSQMEKEALVETGIGIEKIGWNPVTRMLQSENPFVRNLAVGMVDVGGMMQKKVTDLGLEMDQSVETTFRTTYLSKLLDSVRASDEAYLAYRNISVPKTDAGRAVTMMKTKVTDMVKGGDSLGEVQFRHRVGMAMRRGDVDEMNDAASPYVTKAAKEYRKTFNFIKKEAESVRLFERELQKQIDEAVEPGLKAELTEKLKKLREQGVTANNAVSYLPRIYRVDKIMDNQQGFLSIVENYARRSLRLDAQAAKAYANDVLDTVTHRRPYVDLEGVSDNLDWIKTPSGAQARTLGIPDDLLEEFLENDVETLLRHHVKTMGMDIELTRKYGDVSMSGVLNDITQEYSDLIKKASNAKKRGELKKAMEADLRDIRGLRDRLRGTYGASKDPHALSSRFVRNMKSINTLAGMGSAVVSSVPDVARLVMVEGFENAYSKGFSTLFNRQAKLVRQLSKKELDQAAIAVDATLGLRSHAMSDLGDLFGSRYTIERKLNQATGMFFLFNGLNIWNQALKEMAGNMTMLRMTEGLMKPWSKLTKAEQEKFLKNGIGQQDHMRMQQQIRQFGRQEGKEWLPESEAWTDATMRLKFRNALNQNVERIIITPGAGDRALWTSTEFGSMLTQFKSYGQGAMVRMLTAGLQEKDGAFWQGAFLIVGLAGIINEIKRLQYGIDSDEDVGTKLINAIDRSGIGGWFTDVNNAIEKISDHKLGMRPFFTDQPQYQMPFGAKAGAVAGPTASNLINMADVASDVVTFNADEKTLRNSRFFFPTGNLFYLDPIYDGVFGEGNVNRQQTGNRE